VLVSEGSTEALAAECGVRIRFQEWHFKGVIQKSDATSKYLVNWVFIV
jgi:hypothetical protein